MSKKSERNQVQQPSKAEKAYGGYLPSVEDPTEDNMGADGKQAVMKTNKHDDYDA